MPITLQCSNCTQGFAAADEHAGQMVACPSCQQVMQVPTPVTPQPIQTTAAPAPQPGDQFRVSCGNCGSSIRVPRSLIGRTGACPKCKAAFVIPDPNVPAAGAIPASQPATPVEINPVDIDPVAINPVAINPTAEGLPVPVAAPVPINPQPQVYAQTPGVYQQQTPQAYSPNQLGYGQPQNPYRSPNQVGRRPMKPIGTSPMVTITKVCGILLMVLAGLNGIFHTVSSIAAFATSKAELVDRMQSRNVSADPMMVYAIMGVLVVVTISLCAFLAFAGFQMFSHQQWGVALAGCIAALIPCACYTYILSFPVGVLGIVMLCQPDVQKVFK